MTDLGTFGGAISSAYGLNNLGQVAGYSTFTTGSTHSFLYTGGALTDILSTSYYSKAYGINDSGQVAGEYVNSSGYRHAFLYQNGTITDLDPGVTTRRTTAFGINASGQIYGGCGPISGYFSNHFVYNNGALTEYASDASGSNITASVNGITDDGLIAGTSCCKSGYDYPYVYVIATGALTDISVSSSYPMSGGVGAIANNGQVAGYLLDSNSKPLGFIYDSHSGSYTYLNAWSTAPAITVPTQPNAINILGQAGGQAEADNWHAFVSNNGLMYDVNSLIDSTLGITLQNVSHINDIGQLIATSGVITQFNPFTSGIAYLLTPVLSVTSAHSGNFTPGQQNAAYTLTVTNSASAPQSTSGTIAVTESLPSAFTLVSMSGQGWTCASNTCTRSDSIAPGASYPTIAVKVNVAATVASPQVNRASVSEGGIQLGAAIDSTVVQTLGASTTTAFAATAPFGTSSHTVTLTATVSTSGGTVNGGTVSFIVAGIGTATSGTVTAGNASATLTLGAGATAGAHTIDAVYSGTGGIAGSSDASKSLTISTAVPVIQWATPADMTFGSALGSGQLDATANVPGAFAYTPAAGTVLPQGSNTLSVTFTPTDSTDYSATSASVYVNVVAGSSSASGKPNFVITRTLSRDSSNNIVVAVTATNTGSQPTNATSYPSVALSCRLAGLYPLSASTVYAPIGPGASQTWAVTFPSSAGAAGATVLLTVGGNWNLTTGTCPLCGSLTGTFGSTSRTVLP
jgi:probable HAF family extracellular repeat protein